MRSNSFLSHCFKVYYRLYQFCVCLFSKAASNYKSGLINEFVGCNGNVVWLCVCVRSTRMKAKRLIAIQTGLQIKCKEIEIHFSISDLFSFCFPDTLLFIYMLYFYTSFGMINLLDGFFKALCSSLGKLS